MSTCNYSHLIFDSNAQNICWTKERIFNEWSWEKWKLTCRRKKLDLYLFLCMKINSKWITDLNVKPEMLELLRENTGSAHKASVCERLSD